MAEPKPNVFCTALVGILLIPLGCYSVWKNEENHVCSSAAYQDASKHTKELGRVCSINQDDFGSFLHLTCPVDNESLVTTEQSIGISARGSYKLTFLTEQYGYVEKSTTQRKCANKDCSETRNEKCSCFELGWTSNPVTESSFYAAKLCDSCKKFSRNLTTPQPALTGGSSPTTKLGRSTSYADHVPLGDGTIKIYGEDIKFIRNQQLMSPPESPSVAATNSFYLVSSGYCDKVGQPASCYYSTIHRQVTPTSDSSHPYLGDLRITVQAYGSTVLSALGKEVPDIDNYGIAVIIPQAFGQSTLPPCKARSLFYVTNGSFTATDIYEILHNNLSTQTQVLRVLSFLLICLGFNLVLMPVKELVEHFPVFGSCLGSLVGSAICIFATLITTALWLTVFAIAWVFYRPVVGISLLLVAIILAYGSFYHFVQKKDDQTNFSQNIEESDIYVETDPLYNKDSKTMVYS